MSNPCSSCTTLYHDCLLDGFPQQDTWTCTWEVAVVRGMEQERRRVDKSSFLKSMTLTSCWTQVLGKVNNMISSPAACPFKGVRGEKVGRAGDGDRDGRCRSEKSNQSWALHRATGFLRQSRGITESLSVQKGGSVRVGPMLVINAV